MVMVLFLLVLLHGAMGASRAGTAAVGLLNANLSNNTAAVDLKASRDYLTCSLQDAESGFCSPWAYCDKGECMCGETPNEIMRCSVGKNLSIIDYNCVTYDESSGIFEAGSCMYTSLNTTSVQRVDLPVHILPRDVSALNDFLCGKRFNRTGTLCGKCKEHHYTFAYSFDMTCVRCRNGNSNWWKFVLTVFLPLTILYFLVFFLNLNVTSTLLYNFVVYSQIISIPAVMRLLLLDVKNRPQLQIALRVMQLVYGVWNLDFLRSFDLGICLQTTSLQTLALEYLVGLYPQLLLLPTYLLIHSYESNFKPFVVLWKPFQRVFGFIKRKWDIKTSLVDSFATFFLLSNLKFLSVSFDLLVPVKVYQLNSSGHLTHTWRLYYDATIVYFGPDHLPYAVMAVIVLSVYVIFPSLLLTAYPFRWFQRALNLVPIRWYILHTFMDSFQGCYKDGTEPGTRDCRWFASMHLFTGYLLLIIGAFTCNTSFFPLASLVLVFVALLFITVQPFKQSVAHYANTTAMFLLLLALWYVSLLGIVLSKMRRGQLALFAFRMTALVGMAPSLYMLFISARWIFSRRRFATDFFSRIKRSIWRRGYERL